MKSAPIDANEAERLAALRRYGILDTPAEAEFDDFTHLASQICGTPIALISLVDAGRQWFKSKVGLDASETPRDISFCGHAIHGRDIFEVPNALEDERFSDNPLVTGGPAIRFYAGMPLVTPDGQGVGTLCVIDSVPHTLTGPQREALAALGRQVVRQLELTLAIRRERELHETLSRQSIFQKTLLDSAALAIISTTVDGIITSFNPAAEQMLGYSATELIGSQTPAVFHDGAEVVARAQQLSVELGRDIAPGFDVFVIKALSGESESREWTYVCKGGGRVPVRLSVSAMRDENGALTGYLGIARDITDEIFAEQSIREFKSTLDQTLDCVFMFDADTLKFFYANQGALGQIGYTSDELMCMHPYDIKPDMPELQFRALIAPLVSGERSTLTFETDHQHKNGARVPVEIFLQYIAPQRERSRFVAIVRDITERKRMEQMKAEFISTVSHELRTPLTSISGALGLLVGGTLGELPEQATQMLNIAHKNSMRLSHLINDLLDMEKLAAGKMRLDFQVQPLMPLVEQALESIHPYGEQYQVRFELAERADAVQVRVDGIRLQQVLSNFLSNAAKFSPQGGQVEIVVRQRNGLVRIEVIDHGTGIPEEFRSRIFQKFSQADSSNTRQKGGTGLGLAISRELVESMGGTVGFVSAVGQGTHFYCELPVWRAQASALPESVLKHGGPRLLVVEDEPDIARLLQILLSRAGYSVDVALTGQAALDCLAQNQYAAMTLDLMLPDHNGVALIRQIRSQAETVGLPIIVVSANSDDGKLAVSGDFMAIDWLDKPIQEDRLIDAVRRALPIQSDSKPRVLHVEDDADLHRIIATIGRDVADFDLARSLAEARGKLAREHYNLVVLDIGLPDGSGWDLLPLLKTLDPEPPVIVLSGADPTQAQRSAVASALLKTRTSNQDLLDTLSRQLAKRLSAGGDSKS